MKLLTLATSALISLVFSASPSLSESQFTEVCRQEGEFVRITMTHRQTGAMSQDDALEQIGFLPQFELMVSDAYAAPVESLTTAKAEVVVAFQESWIEQCLARFQR